MGTTCHAVACAGREGPNWSSISILLSRVAVAGGVVALCCLLPGPVLASEAAPVGFLELIMQTVESLGPLGPAAFVAAVTFCECIPLFPTQPVSLAAGLLFGAGKGAALVWAGAMLAALVAFQVSRSGLRPLAERLIRAEMSEGQGGEEEASGTGGSGKLKAMLWHVEEAIEHGSFGKQSLAIFLLRMTPLVPYRCGSWSDLLQLAFCSSPIMGQGGWRGCERAGSQPPLLTGSLCSPWPLPAAVPQTTCWA